MQKKGFVLVFSFFIISILLVLVMAIVARSITETGIAQRYLRSTQALWLAEAGVQRAIWELNNGGGNWSGWTTAANGNKTILSALGSIGQYYVEVANPTSNNPTVTATGYAPDSSSQGHMERPLVIELASTPQPIFTYAVLGKASARLSGNGITDSYQSSLGAYGGSNRGSNGDVGTNGGTAGAINLSGNARVNGDASTGPNGTVSISGNAQVTGTISDDTNVNLSSVTVPSSLTSLSSSGGYSVSGNNSATISAGNYKFSDLSVSGNGQLTIQGPASIYLTSTTSPALKISGNGLVTVTGQVTFYIDGTASISGNGIANTSQLPQNLLLYSTYAGAGNGISITGNADLYGAIYAPDTGVLNSGNGSIFGAVIGNTVQISGNGNTHYDESLANAVSPLCTYTIQKWQEQQAIYPLQ